MSSPSKAFKESVIGTLMDLGQDWEWVWDADWHEMKERLGLEARFTGKMARRLAGLYGNACQAVSALEEGTQDE